LAIRPTQPTATVGVVEHGNSAVLVTVDAGSELLDRRRVDLTNPPLPAHPYHHEGSWAVGRYLDTPWAKEISLPDAGSLIERVHEAAAEGAHEILNGLAIEISEPIKNIAIRQCPALPPTIEARIADNRAQTFADTVMYRMAPASAAEARAWSVHWYDRDKVFGDAQTALGTDIKGYLASMGRAVGPPWQAKHKLAAAAAIAFARHGTTPQTS